MNILISRFLNNGCTVLFSAYAMCNHLVLATVSKQSKGLVAMAAFVRLFSSVKAHVLFQF